MKQTKSKYLDFIDFKLESFTFSPIVEKDKKRISLKHLSVLPNIEIYSSEDNNKLNFFIRLKLVINKEKKPGYYISASFLGIFQLRNLDKLDERIVNQYIIFTALPIVISSARIELSNLTHRGVFGEYFLPAIDLQALIRKLSN